MKRTDCSRLLGLGCILLSASICRAGVVYDVSLNTSPLIGHAAGPFSLGFQLNDGSGAGDANNTAILSAFQFGVGGSALGTPVLAGGATGSLASGVTITDSSFFNAFSQQFNPGSLLQF